VEIIWIAATRESGFVMILLSVRLIPTS